MTHLSTSSMRIFSPSLYTTPLPSSQPGVVNSPESEDVTSGTAATTKSTDTKKINGQTDKLDRTEILEIEKLKQRDREVTAHEMAHIVAGGPYVRGGATFQYQYGPDGHRYAVGGEVSIDMSQIPEDPEATIAKMRTVIRAAMAPASPSSQDRMVAAKASRVATDAQMELIQLKMALATTGYRKTAETVSANESPSVKPKGAVPESGGALHLIG